MLPNLEDSDSEDDSTLDSAAADSSDDESDSGASTFSTADSDGVGHRPDGEDVAAGGGEGVDAGEPKRLPVVHSASTSSLEPGSGTATPRAADANLPETSGEETGEQPHGEVKTGSGADGNEQGTGAGTAVILTAGTIETASGSEEGVGSGERTKEERLGPRKTRVIIRVRPLRSAFAHPLFDADLPSFFLLGLNRYQDAAYSTFFALLYYVRRASSQFRLQSLF
jgi:hypothetical protein